MSCHPGTEAFLRLCKSAVRAATGLRCSVGPVTLACYSKHKQERHGWLTRPSNVFDPYLCAMNVQSPLECHKILSNAESVALPTRVACRPPPRAVRRFEERNGNYARTRAGFEKAVEILVPGRGELEYGTTCRA